MKNERHVAISVLLEINQQGAYNNIALRRAFEETPGLEPHHKAFVTELVNGTLRNLILIDHIIDSYSKNQKSSPMKPFIRELLRTAIYQIRWMDRVPNSAAVNEAVKLAKACGFQALSGFVNGILRNIVRGQESTDQYVLEQETLPLDLKYSFPAWLSAAIVKWMGRKGAEDFFATSHIPPGVTICANVLKTTREGLADSLKLESSELAGACLHFSHAQGLMASDAYKDGHFFAIDEGAYLAAQALEAKPGQKIIDLCAAPGGKAFALAGMMENRGQIIACDIHPHKINLITKTAARLGIDCIDVEERDATIVNPDWEETADAVLLDAPCSGFGVIRKRPDIKYTKTYQDVLNLASLQMTLLSAAATYVKPGGVLVYCTCTITPEENEYNIRWFLRKHEAFALELTTKHDGFYIARLRKCE